MRPLTLYREQANVFADDGNVDCVGEVVPSASEVSTGDIEKGADLRGKNAPSGLMKGKKNGDEITAGRLRTENVAISRMTAEGGPRNVRVLRLRPRSGPGSGPSSLQPGDRMAFGNMSGAGTGVAERPLAKKSFTYVARAGKF